MKKTIVLLCILTHFLCTSYCQVNINSLGFNYSALVRDTVGRVQPLKSVKLRFTLLLGQNGTTANSPWIETQSATTDAYGFVNVTIGNGTKAGGTAATFSEVDFALTNFWILIQVYNTFTRVFDPLAKQALQAVPYAKVAGALAGGSAIPAGTIVAFGGDNTKVPDGWMLCDGRELDNTDAQYQALFNAIQYNWGTSNHTNLFRIPETRGYFLRGTANGSSNDPDRTTRVAVHSGGNSGDNVGSAQADGLKRHTHVFDYSDAYYSEKINGAGGTEWGSGDTDKDNKKLVTAMTGTTRDGSANGLISGETRPRNVYVNYIIKL